MAIRFEPKLPEKPAKARVVVAEPVPGKPADTPKEPPEPPLEASRKPPAKARRKRA